MSRLYSDDRESLALEIRGVLKSRGFWCPETSGPDLITAVARALDASAWRPVSEPPEASEDDGGFSPYRESPAVLVHSANWSRTQVGVYRVWKDEEDDYEPRWIACDQDADTIDNPTHWRPLPEGPK